MLHKCSRALAAPLSAQLWLKLSCSKCPLLFQSCYVVGVIHYLRFGVAYNWLNCGCCGCFFGFSFFRLWLHMPEGEALWSGSVTHHFFGDTLLFVGFSSSFRFGTVKTKELGLFFFLNLAARKKEDKRRNVFLFFHLFALCADWTLVALTAGFKFFFLWVGGAAREEE